MPDTKKRTIKTIKVNADKCNGCRACEVICSSSHSMPRFSSVNPARARIHITRRPLEDLYLPVFAGEYTAAECAGRNPYTIDGKQYDECSLCRASCPSRDLFREPDSNLPLKCDMCESDPDTDLPWCVKWCLAEALTYEEREEEAPAAVTAEDLDNGLEEMARKHGWPKVLEAIQRMEKKA